MTRYLQSVVTRGNGSCGHLHLFLTQFLHHFLAGLKMYFFKNILMQWVLLVLGFTGLSFFLKPQLWVLGFYGFR